jgi:hypothetical protein
MTGCTPSASRTRTNPAAEPQWHLALGSRTSGGGVALFGRWSEYHVICKTNPDEFVQAYTVYTRAMAVEDAGRVQNERLRQIIKELRNVAAR